MSQCCRPPGPLRWICLLRLPNTIKTPSEASTHVLPFKLMGRNPRISVDWLLGLSCFLPSARLWVACFHSLRSFVRGCRTLLHGMCSGVVFLSLQRYVLQEIV